MIHQFAAIWQGFESQIDTLGLSLVHFLWQGALAAAVAKALMWKLRDGAARIRYAAACLCLLAMALAPVATYLWLSRPAATSMAMDWDLSPVPSGLGMAYSPAAGVVPHDWMPFLVAAWFAGATLLTLRLLAGWTLSLAWRRAASRATPVQWLCHIERLRVLLNVGQKVRLVFTPRIDSPAVVGWLRPVVLMPLHMTGLAPEQAELLLAHELAHVRRHDALVNFLQRAVEAALFYHPAVWWLSSRIRGERENCCDDIAVSLCGDPMLYARTLVALEESRAALPSLAVAANGGDLVSRVRRILGLREETTDPWTPIAVTVLTLGLLFVDSPAYRSTVLNRFPSQWSVSQPVQTWAASRLDTLLAFDEASRPSPFRVRRDERIPRKPMFLLASAPAEVTLDDQDFEPAPPAPPAPPSGDSWNWSWSWSRNGDGGSVNMNENSIRFVDEGKHYIIRDPAILAQARALFGPIRAMGKEQREAAHRQREAAHADAMMHRERNLAVNAELREEMARLQSQIRAAVNRQNTAEIEELARKMADKAKEFSTRVTPRSGEMKVQMDEMNSRIRALNEETKRKGDRMKQMGDEARHKLNDMLKDAVRSGKAQLENLQ